MQNSSIHVKLKYLGEDNDVFTGEFLFELTDDLLLNFLPRFQLWEWDEDDNSLATRTNIEFTSRLKSYLAQIFF